MSLTGMNTPLEKAFIEVNQDGKKFKIKALDKHWVENINFIKYEPLPLNKNFEVDVVNNSIEIWKEKLQLIEDDLKYLLSLPYHKFWSQVVYHRNLHEFLNSYLEHAPRFYDIHNLPVNENLQGLQQSVHRLVFIVYIRMALNKESKDNITDEVFGDLIYENYIFDIPKIFDLCTLYGHSNRILLEKLVKNIFKYQPKYCDDLILTVPDIIKSFEAIEINLGIVNTYSPSPKLAVEKISRNISWEMLLDNIFYIVDNCSTVYSFLEIYGSGCQVFCKENYISRLAIFYERVIPFITKEICRQTQDGNITEMVQKEVFKRLSYARRCMLDIFHIVVTTCFVQPSLESNDVESRSSLCEDYLEIIVNILTEKTFLRDYHKLYPISDNLDMFQQLVSFIDEKRISYILEAINASAGGINNQSKNPIEPTVKNNDTSKMHSLEMVNLTNGVTMPNYETRNEPEGACAPKKSGIELTSLISQVKDLFPDLGDGFIELCLEHYNYESEAVINALLENLLPSNLQKLDRNLERIPEKETVSSSILAQRKNVFDNDEFDVFSRDDIDRSRIHKGKRGNAHKDVKTFLDDKSEEVNALTKELNNKIQETITDSLDQYDDEYDDTYDDPVVGAEADETDELLKRRPFTQPRVLMRYSPDSSESSSEEETNNLPQFNVPRDHFVEDPAVVRERLAARARSRGRRGSFTPRNFDVKGVRGGHGQEANVTHDRHYKEKHKSSRGNHNRRKMADRKRSQGMFPS